MKKLEGIMVAEVIEEESNEPQWRVLFKGGDPEILELDEPLLLYAGRYPIGSQVRVYEPIMDYDEEELRRSITDSEISISKEVEDIYDDIYGEGNIVETEK